MISTLSRIIRVDRIKSKSPLWLDFLVLFLCIIIAYFRGSSYLWTPILIALIIFLYVDLYIENIKLIGIRKVSITKTLLWGFLPASMVIIGIINFLIPLIESFIGQNSAFPINPFDENKHLMEILDWKTILSISIGKEIFFRGYCFYVLERIIGTNNNRKNFIVVLTAIVFGLLHLTQGAVTVIMVMMASAVLGFTFYLSRRNLLAMIFADIIIYTSIMFSIGQSDIPLFF